MIKIKTDRLISRTYMKQNCQPRELVRRIKYLDPEETVFFLLLKWIHILMVIKPALGVDSSRAAVRFYRSRILSMAPLTPVGYTAAFEIRTFISEPI